MRKSAHLLGPESRWPQRAALLAIALVSLWPSDRALALDPTTDILQYNCRTWSRQTGLPVNGINAIAQTKDGYVWLGTAAGLIRCDGIEFKLFDLAPVSGVRNGTVLSLASAREGGLWVGLGNSAMGGFFDGQTFAFRGKEIAAGANLNVHSLLESKAGTLWLAAAYAVRLLPSGDYEEIKLNPDTNVWVNAICNYEDSQGRIWFGAAVNGAYCYETGKVTHLSDPALETTPVSCIAEDAQGQIWLGTDNGLKCYGPDLQPRKIPELTGEIPALLVDRHGVLWIGAASQGLVRYQHGVYRFLGKTDGLAGNSVNALAEDREGNLWVGTRDGLSLLTDVKFPTCPTSEDPKITVAWAVGASRQNAVWIGSRAGLTYFDGKLTTFTATAGLPNTFVKRVFEASNGDVYMVSGTKDLVIMSGGKVVAKHTIDRMVVGITEDAQGVVVSIDGDLYRAGTNVFKPYSFTNDAPPLGWVLNLMTGRDGALWASTVNGIFRIKDGGFRQWGGPEGITNPAVQWLCEDNDGVIWGALMQGVVRLKDGQIQCIGRENGLFDNNIFSIVPDNFGNLWLDSGRGIFRVACKSMNDFAESRTDRVECVPYDGPESVRPADKSRSQEHVAGKTPDGRIWFPGSKGVVMIDPAHIPTNQIVPPVFIDRVLANGHESAAGKPLVVPPGHGELEVHFTALSFIASQKIRFRYQLQGYDNEWVEAGDRRLAFYTNLKPGHYTFRVIAANADGIWNEQGTALKIELLSHYYQTAWFYALCGGLTFAALVGIYAWRVRVLKVKQRALQESRILLETQVQLRTAQLAKANSSLVHEVDGHKRTATELEQRTLSLEDEIEERKRMEKEIERVHRQLLDTSRQAGMAEVATNVLHNVGNVLNSVNVASLCVADGIRKSKAANLAKVVGLLREHQTNLGAFFTENPQGKQIPGYLAQLTDHLSAERAGALKELDGLQKHIEHIKDIVSGQQSFAKVSGVTETLSATDLVEDALKMNSSALVRHDITVTKEFQTVPPLTVEKHKVLGILVNLVQNAKQACDESGQTEKQLTLRVTHQHNRVRIAVSDNGVGIRPENLDRIFAHGFTTKKNGHGFGLHSGALTARELGGSLTVQSDGPGQGAMFTLELPLAAADEISRS